MGLLERIADVRPRRTRSITTIDEYALALSQFMYGGGLYGAGVQQTIGGQAERITVDLVGLASAAYGAHGPVFALMAVRMRVFSAVRLAWQQMRGGRPGRTFGTPELSLLETPWAGGTTQDLLTAMIVDLDLSGNSYITRVGEDLVRLRPDWMSIVLEPRLFRGGTLGYRRVGYLYEEGGLGYGDGGIPLLPDEVCHFTMEPDPLATYRGMSWLTPVLRELQNDKLMQTHQRKFFENGAAQPNDAAVLTPTGWTRMEDVTVGSQVVGPNGKPRSVLGVYPQGEKDIYRLTFEGGATTESCEDHLWQVSNLYDRRRSTHRVMSLREIIDHGVVYPSGAAKWAIPLTDPVEYASSGPLPLDPYLLGLLLGDGSFRGNGKGSGGVSLAVSALDVDETERTLQPLLPEGVTISRRDRGGWSDFYFRGPGRPRVNPLTRIVRELGLFDVVGCDKAVPESYMRASIGDRIALLQGLIDSDGHVNRGRRSSTGVGFTSTSRALSHQVRELAQSLGGTASCAPEGRNGIPGRRPQWRVHINRLPEWIVPVRLSRKVADYRSFGGSGAHRGQTLKSVEFVRREQAQCIKVDAPDGLYVTDDFIVTHNTPNMVISLDGAVKPDIAERFIASFRERHEGVENAYRTLMVGGGADVTVVGSNFEQMAFTGVQGRGETRLAAAAGVPVTIVGFSEGLQGSSLNAGNFGQARRQFADGTMHALWASAAGSLQQIFSPPPGARLWFDARDVPFLREDARDAAEIQQTKAITIRQLVDAGYTPESVVAAVDAEDMTLLVHSGLYSVQLQPPGASTPAREGGADG